jgi:hypothetical protein
MRREPSSCGNHSIGSLATRFLRASARSAVDSLAEQLDLHLGMTFHRFLSGEVEGRKRLRIKVNERSVTLGSLCTR